MGSPARLKKVSVRILKWESEIASRAGRKYVVCAVPVSCTLVFSLSGLMCLVQSSRLCFVVSSLLLEVWLVRQNAF